MISGLIVEALAAIKEQAAAREYMLRSKTTFIHVVRIRVYS